MDERNRMSEEVAATISGGFDVAPVQPTSQKDGSTGGENPGAGGDTEKNPGE